KIARPDDLVLHYILHFVPDVLSQIDADVIEPRKFGAFDFVFFPFLLLRLLREACPDERESSELLCTGVGHVADDACSLVLRIQKNERVFLLVELRKLGDRRAIVTDDTSAKPCHVKLAPTVGHVPQTAAS